MTIKQLLVDTRKAVVYAAVYLRKISQWKLEHLEDQLCDIQMTLDREAFNSDSYWADTEVRVALLYLQDLIFEFPGESPKVLAERALEAAQDAVKTLRGGYK
jgi:hypothetical protein